MTRELKSNGVPQSILWSSTRRQTRRACAFQAYDGMRGDLPDSGAFYAVEFAAPQLCRECVEICTECAKDCKRVGGMDECVQACA
jgi:hypothetical protein